MATFTGGNTQSNIDIGKWLNTLYGDYQTDRTAKQGFFEKGVSTLQDTAALFQPGGAYGAGTEASISRAGDKAVASGYQNLVSAGLSNTTTPSRLRSTFEEEVGVPARLRSEDRRFENLAGAQGNLANLYANYNPGGPTAGNISMLATGGFSGLNQRYASELGLMGQLSGGSPYPYGRFDDQFSGSEGTSGNRRLATGGAGGSSGGGGDSFGPSQRIGSSGGFSNPYSTGSGTNPNEVDFQGVFMAGAGQITPGSADPYADKRAQIEANLAKGGARAGETAQQTYDAAMAQLNQRIASEQQQGQTTSGSSTPTLDDPFFQYASQLPGGTSQYI